MILTKTEQAAVAYVQSQGIGIDDDNIVPGKTSSEKDGTTLICSAISATEEPMDSGNYFVDLDFELRSIGLQDGVAPETQHNVILTALETALKSSTLAEDLTASLDGFHCFHAQETPRAYEVEQDAMVDRFSFRLYACPSDISA